VANAVGVWNVIPLQESKFATYLGPAWKQVTIRADGTGTVAGSQLQFSIRNNANCGALWFVGAGLGESYMFIQDANTLIEWSYGKIFKLVRA
jgi:hypothetical protein